MRKFFTDFEYIDGMNEIKIDENEAKHILKVLRLKIGDRFIISNFHNQSFESQIVNDDLKCCVVKLINKVDITNKSNVNITIFQGYPKGDKLDLIVQKLTELGVKEIFPILTKRTVVKFNPSKFKLERLQKISKEACKQCGISTIPHINTPIEFESIDEKFLSKYDLILIPYENNFQSLKKVLREREDAKNICVFIGSEGGFELEEVEKIKGFGGVSVSLGQRILRTETASIFISSVLQYEFGDVQQKF